MKKIILFILLAVSIVGYSQGRRIKILQADNTFTDPKYPDATITLGNVFVEHAGATMRCDKAYIYQEKQLIKAMGNVVVNQGDTIHQYSKYTDYDGKTQIATSWGKVLLEDELMTLETDTLKFDRVEQKLYYNYKGTIKDTANVLVSDRGKYHLKTNKFEAFDNVLVTNRDGSTLDSDHLEYYTSTGVAELFGPSNIISEDNTIYTEKGTYDSKIHRAYFTENSKIFYKDVEIKGDSLYYDKTKGFASATGNFKMTDTVNNSIVKGGYAEVYRLKDSVFVTKRAVAISELEAQDSIYIHGQKLMVLGKENDRVVKAFNRVKFFKSDLQGKCDSLVSNERTGLTELFTKPVIWAQGNQITGDTIHLISNPKTEQLDSLKIISNGFMIKKDSAGFSQLKGRVMYGKFLENKLRSLNIIGNSESIIYIRDEKDELFGIDKKQSSNNIFIEIEDNKISAVSYFKAITAKTYPPSLFPEEEKKFKGFIWREEEQPLTKDDIFKHDSIDDVIIEEDKEKPKPKKKTLEDIIPKKKEFNKTDTPKEKPSLNTFKRN
ncbi:OstA-like protein [Lutibacter sp. TH_r2]|uniref:OstA-like protein n=1 Tax=Lutibacter sp. TH_r2 TaxID=3082083 RepID=UPI002955CF4E|nr:OstA-like protein [Lutibacter sp. TH_r2]MDV7187564.1 OstA-like protein [Lutibacter sp. TH_r2]